MGLWIIRFYFSPKQTELHECIEVAIGRCKLNRPPEVWSMLQAELREVDELLATGRYQRVTYSGDAARLPERMVGTGIFQVASLCTQLTDNGLEQLLLGKRTVLDFFFLFWFRRFSHGHCRLLH